MGYSQVSDLLLGDLIISTTIDRQRYVDDAASEIDSKIGHRYTTPLTLADLADHSRKLILKINNHIATARLIMSTAVAAQDSSVNAYAEYLLSQAFSELAGIAMGSPSLDGATVADATFSNRGPSATGGDAFSAIDHFYDFAMGGACPTPWSPSAGSTSTTSTGGSTSSPSTVDGGSA